MFNLTFLIGVQTSVTDFAVEFQIKILSQTRVTFKEIERKMKRYESQVPASSFILSVLDSE